jgi:hypothetical protein
MRRLFFALIAGLFLCPTFRAQEVPDKGSCQSYALPKTPTSPYHKKLWDGYEISLGPARNSHGGGDECTAAIYNRAGRVVFRTTGYGVIFEDKLTGQDFDDDGKPEVVFNTDTGGGNHCCWAYNVISLAPKPHKLFDIEAPGAARFEKDKQGKMVIWQRVPGPYGFTSMAGNPFAERVFRVRNGELVEATPEFCSRIFSNENEDYKEWNAQLTAENISKLRSSGDVGWDNEQIVSALLSRAVQHVFCHQFDYALGDLNLWPESSKAKMKAAFVKAMAVYDPAFAKPLQQQTTQTK